MNHTANVQLILSQNRFFSIDAELLKSLKPEILLDDHTRVDQEQLFYIKIADNQRS